MRNMSFSMTTPQMERREKTVTRRFAWWNAKPGDRVMAVKKAMGLKKGEKIERLYPIEIVSVRREPLSAMSDDPEYGREELRLEGYPFDMTEPSEFVARMAPKGDKDAIVNRIEFKEIKNV